MSKMFNYEADQIHDLVHPDLLTDTSHYVAECIDIILTESTPNYPKLCDYEKEWLYFAENDYRPGHPENLEYQEVNTNGTATVQNVIPFSYKSAILKGNTLVNLAPNDTFKGSVANRGQEFTLTQPIQPNKQYILLVNITKDDTVGGWHCRFTDGVNYPVFQASIKGVGLKKVVFTTSIALSKFFPYFDLEDCEQGRYITMENVMLLEYQQGMENWDIPYFEGMQSVKMPVLTTIGKNLFNCTNVEYINNSYTVVNMNNKNYITTDTLVEKGKQYTLSLHANISGATGNTLALGYMNYSNIVGGVERASHIIVTIDSMVDKTTSITFTAQATDYIKIYIATGKVGYNVVLSNVQIEEGTATTYEPYKSNILTVNEDVTLRSNGDVYDELNLLTGRLTQRIDENNEVLAQAVVKTVDLNGSLIKPYEGTNHYTVSSETIPPHLQIIVPVESTGAQTLHDITSQED